LAVVVDGDGLDVANLAAELARAPRRTSVPEIDSVLTRG